MVSLDLILSVVVEEAAKVDRRSTSQFLTNAIEDAIFGMEEEQMQMVWSRVKHRIAASDDLDQSQELLRQAHAFSQKRLSLMS